MIAVDPELPGPEPERELPPDGIWDGRDVEQAAMSGPGWDRRDDGPDRRDR